MGQGDENGQQGSVTKSDAGEVTAEDANRPSDEEILKYETEINAEYINAPLISEVKDFNELVKEYATGLPVFKDKINHIASTCTGMRTVKRDGNCFYRAFAFRLCELVWVNAATPWASAVIERATATKTLMTEAGYDMSILSDFWEPLEMALTPQPDVSKLYEMFQTDYIGDTIVCYLRLVTAAYMKQHRDLFEAFILDSFPTLETFIGSQVEPMSIEADQPQIVAMVNGLGITVKIANLDPSPTDTGINYHELSPMEEVQDADAFQVELLYRPGHYDILYSRSKV
ncbi:peptidase C65 Otubain-domain-containing protein [Gaertneriomyces semiglobifer]|nr:peptidase C65 Otubain-domain-containing protein [Gaertneriomyces semiglobifer]